MFGCAAHALHWKTVCELCLSALAISSWYDFQQLQLVT